MTDTQNGFRSGRGLTRRAGFARGLGLAAAAPAVAAALRASVAAAHPHGDRDDQLEDLLDQQQLQVLRRLELCAAAANATDQLEDTEATLRVLQSAAGVRSLYVTLEDAPASAVFTLRSVVGTVETVLGTLTAGTGGTFSGLFAAGTPGVALTGTAQDVLNALAALLGGTGQLVLATTIGGQVLRLVRCEDKDDKDDKDKDKDDHDGTRPGWGHGDDNHVHTGPPGQQGDGGNGNGNRGRDR